MRHGKHCSCIALAAARHVSATAIDFEYCHEVLQKRWAITCRHGIDDDDAEQTPRALPALGGLDGIQAILVTMLARGSR